MNLLTDYEKKSYSYVSRYSAFRYAYNKKDDKYVYMKTSQLSKDTPYVTIKVKVNDTLDSLAAKYYGRPDYYWIIADFNRISDPFIDLPKYFKEVQIPTLTSIEYEG